MKGQHRLRIALLLAMFAAPKNRPPTQAEVAKKLAPFLEYTLGRAGARAAIAHALEEARDDGLLEVVSGKSARFRLTASAEAVLHESFAELKAGTWSVLRDKYLLPLAGNVGGHRLPGGFGATRAAILAEALGLGERLARAKSEAQILNRTLAGLVGARTDSVAALKTAVVRTWLESAGDTPRAGALPSGAPSAAAQPPTAPTPVEPNAENVTFDARGFVRAVRQAARDVAGRDGTPKAFISSVWEALQERGEAFGLNAASFRAALLDAHRAGSLRLSIASLGPSYDQSVLSASALPYRSETFHFIELD